MLKKLLLLLTASIPLFGGQERIASSNGVDIWYETFGSKENPALLLIMGGCCQSVIWHKAFCEKLSDEGFYVIRYDHRDMGLSTCFDFEKDPYDPMDMAKDAIGVLNDAGIKKAHLFGVSLGALLSEILAVYFPEKVHTITLLGSTCDIRPMNLAYAGLPPESGALVSPPSPHYLSWMKEFMQLSPQTQEDQLQQRIEGWNRLNGQKYPLDPKNNREMHSEFLARLRHPQGIINHIRMLRRPQSEEIVRTTPSRIEVPTVILHGSEDPIFPPDHAEGLSRLIKNAEYFFVEGMGHVPNEHFYELYLHVLKQQAAKVCN